MRRRISAVSKRKLIVESLESRHLLASVSGTIFDDINGNGQQDPSDNPLPGIIVYADVNNNRIFDSGEPSSMSDQVGAYRLESLSEGEINIRLVPLPSTRPTSHLSSYERLFAGENPFYEVDPSDGSVIRTFNVPGFDSPEPLFAGGMAFDGTNLYVASTDLVESQVHVFDPDSGNIIRTFDSLPSNGFFAFQGLATVNGTLFLSNWFSDEITSIDPSDGTVLETFDISALNTDSPFYGGPVELQLGLGESADGSSLVASVGHGNVVQIDPQTGLISDYIGQLGSDIHGLAGSNGVSYVAEPYFSENGPSAIQVFDASNNFTQTLLVDVPQPVASWGLAAGSDFESIAFLDLTDSQPVAGVDFGVQTTPGSISGTEFEDSNQNGRYDSGEGVLEGVTVYIDADSNGSLDAGETSVVTGFNGGYLFEDLAPGTHTIRTIAPENYRSSIVAGDEERLFAVRIIDGRASGEMELIELDPTDGAVLSSVGLGIEGSLFGELTFDGEHLFFTSPLFHSELAMYQIDTAGNIVDSHLIDQSIVATVAINGTIFGIRSNSGLPSWSLMEYSPETNEFDLLREIDLEWWNDAVGDRNELDTNFSWGSGPSADGQQILIGGPSDRYAIIDPIAGTATFPISPVIPAGGLEFEAARAAVNSEEFVLVTNAGPPGEFQVFDSDGNLNRTFTATPSIVGLAGGIHLDNSVEVTIAAGQSVANVNHGFLTTLGSVSGHIFDDTDGNSQQDQGESSLAGVSVYVDANHNRQLDEGELVSITDQNGDYRFESLPSGEHFIRQVPIPDRDVRAFGNDQTRLFASSFFGAPGEIVYELDPLSGDIINQLDPPNQNEFSTVLGAHESGLYVVNGSELLRLDPNTGEVLKRENTSFFQGGIVLSVFADDSAYLYDFFSPSLLVLDLFTLEIVDSIDLRAIFAELPEFDQGLWFPGLSKVGNHFVFANGFRNDSATNTYALVDRETRQVIETSDSPYPSYVTSSGTDFYSFIPAEDGGLGMGPLRVLDTLDRPKRILPDQFSSPFKSVGAYRETATEHQIRLFAGDHSADLDFGNVATVQDIHGIQFDDTNENGVMDSGELPLAGITVFVDSNVNGRHDNGEPLAISDTDGTYTLSDVPVGFHVVDTEPADLQPTTVRSERDRLFSIGTSSGMVEIREHDPLTLQVVQITETSIPIIGQVTSTAILGETIFVTDPLNSRILEISFDGRLIDEILIDFDTKPTGILGLAAVDGTLYALNHRAVEGLGIPGHELWRFDPVTNQFYGRMPISQLPEHPLDDPDALTMVTMSVTPDGKSLVLPGPNTLLIVDPLTAQVIDIVEGIVPDPVFISSTTVGDKYLLREEGSDRLIHTFDDQLQLIESVDGIDFDTQTLGLAATHFITDRALVEVMPGSDATGIDFGYTSTGATISGTLFDDTNTNGTPDSGEPIFAGVTVFLDDNRNGLLDTGEASTISDENGFYSFGGLDVGDQYVRVMPTAELDWAATGEDQTRLFTLSGLSDGLVQEHDPITGELLRTLEEDGLSGITFGMAVDEQAIYYVHGLDLVMRDIESGQVVSTTPLPPGDQFTDVAALNGYVYVLGLDNTLLKILPSASSVVELFDLNLINESGPIDPFDVGTGLAVGPDGESLLLASEYNRILIDPESGVIESVTTHDTILQEFVSFGTAAGEIFISDVLSVGSLDGFTMVWNSNEQLIRTLELGYLPAGIGAASMTARRHHVRTSPGSNQTDVNFVSIGTGSKIQGIQFADTNENGVMDSGELPLAGITVFVDTNANGRLTLGEPFAISDSDGSYTIPDVPVGFHFVDTQSSDYRSTTIREERDRLFSVGKSSGMIEIREHDPQTLQVVQITETSIPITGTITSTAVLGETIFVTDILNNVIHEIGFDGTLIDQIPVNEELDMPYGISGLATVNDTLYVLNHQALNSGIANHELWRLDPITNEFYGRTPISQLPDHPLDDPDALTMVTMSVTPDGQSLVLPGPNTLLVVDPLTAKVIDIVDSPVSEPTFISSASVGNRYFLREEGSDELIHVFDEQLQLIESIAGVEFQSTLGLAGTRFATEGARVEVTPGMDVTGINIGQASTNSSVSGSLHVDSNGNGLVDENEQVFAGVTVFLDANRNGLLDNGEVNTTTDSEGFYRFDNLGYGDHHVRVVHDAELDWAAAIEDQTRLFTLGNFLDPTVREIDPVTGQQLREFDTGGPSGGGLPGFLFAGVGIDDDTIYYIDGAGGVSLANVVARDIETGELRWTLPMPNSGLIIDVERFGEYLYLFENNQFTGGGTTIVKVDPTTAAIVETLDLVQINSAHPSSPFDFGTGLITSPDGESLYAFGGTDRFEIDPDTGEITTIIPDQIDLSEPFAVSSAAGKIFIGDREDVITPDGNVFDSLMMVWNSSEQLVRRIPLGYDISGIGAATVTAREHHVSTSPGTNVANLNFIVPDPNTPSDITLSKTSINENSDTSAADLFFASLSAVDSTVEDTHTFELVAGAGDVDNTRFLVSANQLLVKQGVILDHEAKSTFSIRLRVTDASGLSFERSLVLGVNNLIEVLRTTVNDGSEQRSKVNSITIEFDGVVDVQDAGAAAPGAFEVTKRGDGGGLVGIDVSPGLNEAGNTIVTLRFFGQFTDGGELNDSLVDGNYDLRVNDYWITNTAGDEFDGNLDGWTDRDLLPNENDYLFGTAAEDQFYRLFGDSDGDGFVGFGDYLAFRTAYAKSAGQPGFNDAFDRDDSGTVEFSDYLAFRAAFGLGRDFE